MPDLDELGQLGKSYLAAKEAGQSAAILWHLDALLKDDWAELIRLARVGQEVESEGEN